EQRMYREGEVVRLSPRVFELLLLLARNAGQVMDREGLISTLWPDTVVEEANLNVHISALRKALGESPGGHQYIETLPRLGYRFVASVREMEADGGEFNGRAPDKSRGPAASVGHASNGSQLMAADTVTQDEGASSVNRQRGLAVALTALVIGVTTISFVVYLARTGSRVDQPPPQRNLWHLTFDSGLNSEPTWSPDGRLIAYSADRDGNFDIWVQPVGEGNPVRVTTSPAHDWQPDWAPEGNRLVFRRHADPLQFDPATRHRDSQSLRGRTRRQAAAGIDDELPPSIHYAQCGLAPGRAADFGLGQSSATRPEFLDRAAGGRHARPLGTRAAGRAAPPGS